MNYCNEKVHMRCSFSQVIFVRYPTALVEILCRILQDFLESHKILQDPVSSNRILPRILNGNNPNHVLQDPTQDL